MSRSSKIRLRLAATVLALACALALDPLPSGAQSSIGQLRSQLGSQHARQASLAAGLSTLTRVISALSAQVALIQQREASVQAQLASDRGALAGVEAQLAHERRIFIVMTARLAHARAALGAELRSTFESDPPDVMTVVLESHGFADMLDRLDFMRFAKKREQSIIGATRTAKAAAATAARRLAALEVHDRAVTDAVAAQAQAIAAMNQLLQNRRAALESARAARISALAASRTRSGQLQRELTKLEAQLATAGAPGSWAIPAAIVLCESGGQNLPPNSAGASGYYQFLPTTWHDLGGSTPAAYLAPKAEQDRLAGELWNGGRGASNWVCASIVGVG